MTILDELEQFAVDLDEQPLFPVEGPDGKRHLSEIQRQATFINLMKTLAPTVMVFAIPNAGKRNPRLAKKEGITGGVFDLCCTWEGGGICWPEMKGYSSAGRAGELSRSQISWGNDMYRRGHKVACFFDPMSAVNWVRRCGAPVRLTK